MKNQLFLSVLMAGVSAYACGARAQAAPPAAGTQIEEVVVTAQKRSEKAQNVGIAITAFTGAQLRQLGVTQVSDLAKFSPGVNLAGSFAGQETFFDVRGVSQQDFDSIAEGPNAVYIDNGYVGINNISAIGLFDIDHTEVLKGPQGTLFGRNAVGGVINIATKEPTDTYNGFVDYSGGSYDTQRVEAALGGPIVADKLSFRLAGLYDSNGSYIKNLAATGGDLGASQNYGLRGKLELTPTNRLHIEFTGFATRSVDSWAPYFFQNVAPNGTLTGATLTNTPGLFGPNSNPKDLTITAPFAQSKGDFQDMEGAQLAMTYDAGGGVTLTNIVDYKQYASAIKIDNFPNLTPPGHDITSEDFTQFHQFSEEFRAEKDWGLVHLTAGLYYLYLDPKLKDHEDFNGLEPGVIVNDFTKQQTYATAGFAQVDYHIAPKWILILGGRVTADHKAFNLTEALAGAQTILRGPLQRSANADLWTAKAQLEYRPVEHVLLYAGYNRGAKAGGFNVPLAGGNPPNDTELAYKPETLQAYEVGFKADALDNRLRLNGSAFYYDYHDSQSVLFAAPLNPYVINANARTLGSELELQLHPVPNMTLAASATYLDNTVYNIDIVGVTANRTNSYTPKWKTMVLGRYEWSLTNGYIAVQADARYQGLEYTNLSNFAADDINPFWLIGARVSWQDPARKWTVALNGENLTDVRYKTIGNDAFTLGAEQIAYGKPRWLTAEISRSF